MGSANDNPDVSGPESDAQASDFLRRAFATVEALSESAFVAATKQFEIFVSLPRTDTRIFDLAKALSRPQVLNLDEDDVYRLLVLLRDPSFLESTSEVPPLAGRRLKQWVDWFGTVVDELDDIYQTPDEWRRISVNPVWRGPAKRELIRILIQKYKDEMVQFEMSAGSYVQLAASFLDELAGLPADILDSASKEAWERLNSAIDKAKPLTSRAGSK